MGGVLPLLLLLVVPLVAGAESNFLLTQAKETAGPYFPSKHHLPSKPHFPSKHDYSSDNPHFPSKYDFLSIDDFPSKPHFPSLKSDWPCPEASSIAPCICTKDEGDEVIDMDCSDVANDEELAHAFQAYFPFDKFRNLTLAREETENPVPITNLTRETFNNAYFVNIVVIRTSLIHIDLDAFSNSYHYLETIEITDSPLEVFPFDMLAECPNLKELKLDKNAVTRMANLNSKSLTRLQVSNSPRISFGTQVFHGTPNLEKIILKNLHLNYIPDGMFSQQEKLTYLDLTNNELETLYNGSFHLNGPLEQLMLDYNKIYHIQSGAFGGLPQGLLMLLQYNSLSDLPQSVWEPVFIDILGNDSSQRDLVSLRGNPIRCECNLLWLVRNPSYLSLLTTNTACEDGTFIEDVADIILANC